MLGHIEKNTAPCLSSSSASLADLPGLLGKISRKLHLYYQRSRQRARLKTLDDRALKDIGVSRASALREAGKPFWME